MTPDPLDRPIWAALSTTHRPHALGDDRARRYHPDIGPLAAAIDDTAESLADLRRLIATHGGVGLLQAGPAPLPPGCVEIQRADAVQMTATDDTGIVSPDVFVRRLGPADVPEMVDLATLTAPGPFAARTATLGTFLGIRIDGRLAAMAGERTRFPGHTELSGVCTHPDFRGRGLAAALCRHLTADIRKRGDRPFLHAFAANRPAIALYETLGWKIRRDMTFVRLAPA
ncbi:GNAT family N-acetyltransferase [Pinisolibacter sp.]|uniref:GNAT family N-acetyltransferase n=1 Tax=Pinisolibacter sp. TaxID=2172024 RepID=UPI002FDD1150